MITSSDLYMIAGFLLDDISIWIITLGRIYYMRQAVSYSIMYFVDYLVEIYACSIDISVV
jgi:hypothetical protein